MLRKLNVILLLILMCGLPAMAGSKSKGSAKLDDLQTTGDNDKKNKKQRYDFIFVGDGKHYTCRTGLDAKLKATDFVVGSMISYEIDSDKAKLKNPSGKEVKCVIVRVENVSATQK